jgi:hypothetical protein
MYIHRVVSQAILPLCVCLQFVRGEHGTHTPRAIATTAFDAATVTGVVLEPA